MREKVKEDLPLNTGVGDKRMTMEGDKTSLHNSDCWTQNMHCTLG